MSEFMDSLESSNEVIKGPYFGIIYGPPGCGKTELAKHAPNPHYIAIEKGVEKIRDTGKFVKNGELILPKTANDFFDMMAYFIKKKHDYKTVVIDSGMFVDKLFINEILEQTPFEVRKGQEVIINSIGDFAFGRGYAKLMPFYIKFIRYVHALQKKGINVILIAHAKEKTVRSPSSAGDDYKKYAIDMTEFGSVVSIPNLLFAASDWTYFMELEAKTVRKRNAFGTEKVHANVKEKPEIVVYTRSTSYFDAKIHTEFMENVPDSYLIEMGNDATSKIIFNDLEK